MFFVLLYQSRRKDIIVKYGDIGDEDIGRTNDVEVYLIAKKKKKICSVKIALRHGAYTSNSQILISHLAFSWKVIFAMERKI